MFHIKPSLYAFDEGDALSVSSNITKAKYCNMTNTLVLEFGGQSVYMYSALPPSIYRSFCISESKGKYFYNKIRGVYPYKKLV